MLFLSDHVIYRFLFIRKRWLCYDESSCDTQTHLDMRSILTRNHYFPVEMKKSSGDFLLVSVISAVLSSTERHFMSLHKFGQHIYLFIHLLLMMNTSTYIVLTSVLPTFIKIS